MGGNADLQGVVLKLFGRWRLVDTRSGICALLGQLKPLLATDVRVCPIQCFLKTEATCLGSF